MNLGKKIISRRLLSTWKPKSEVKNGRFMNPWREEHGLRLYEIPKKLLNSRELNQDLSFIKNCYVPTKFSAEKIKSTSNHHVTWVGHSSCLVQTDGVYVLTDPIWSNLASPFSFIGPKRELNVPVKVEDIPIDVVIISHSHYDHLDLETAKIIGNKCLWVVPLGLKKILSYAGVTNVVEMDWWETKAFEIPRRHNITKNSNEEERKVSKIEISCLPTRHWSSRTPFDRNVTLWASFAFKSIMGNYYFAGDTGYCPKLFSSIGSSFGPFDLSLIPIGAYKPREIHESAHCDPQEALYIHKDIKSKKSLGIHWGTFNLTDDIGYEPAFELNRVRKDTKVEEFFTMATGECLDINNDFPVHDISQLYPNECEMYNQAIETELKLKSQKANKVSENKKSSNTSIELNKV